MTTTPAPRDIILTGIPRSGTTLTCYLLNQVPDTVALHEPYNPFYYSAARASHRQLANDVERFFSRTRESLLATKIAPSKQLRGQIPDNPKGAFPWFVRALPNSLLGREVLGKRSLRQRRVTPGVVHFTRPLSRSFTLCVKHNAAYTALLDELTKRFRCFAIVRNPLAILASWNSINFDLRDGDMTITSRLDEELSLRLSRQPDRLMRQIAIVEWFFSQYDRFLPEERLIRYEDLVARPVPTLGRILPGASPVETALTNMNVNKTYNRRLMWQLAELLLARRSVIWRYYPPEAIRLLRDRI